MFTKIKEKWKDLESFVHKHQSCYHKAHGLCYASYFTTVIFHGPHAVMATVMLALIFIAWIFHLENH